MTTEASATHRTCTSFDIISLQRTEKEFPTSVHVSILFRTGWKVQGCKWNWLEQEELFSVVSLQIKSWYFHKLSKEQECKDTLKSRVHNI